MTTKSKTQIMSHDDTVMSPITKASNVLFEDGETAQDKLEDNVEKSFTPSVENSSSMFKVGQGDKVDYSENVVDGAYVSCVLKGRTLVNCIQEPSSQDVILPYDFAEGQYVTIHDTKESGALGVELKGQTLVNLYPRKDKITISTSVHTGVISLNYPNKINTKYLCLFEISNINLDSNTSLVLSARGYGINNDFKATPLEGVRVKENGIHKFIWTGSETAFKSILFGVSGSMNTNTPSFDISNIMLIEYQEGMENWDIPYFEGMTSVKTPTVKTVGKNLFDIKNAEELSGWGQHGFELLSNGVAFHARSGWNAIGYRFPSLRNKTVTVTADVTLNVLTNNKNLTQECGIGNKAYIPQKTLSNNTTERVATTFTLGGDGIVWLFGSSSPENTGYGSSDVKWSFTNIQVEEGSTATTYEPHTSSSLTIPNEVVLRSLPNGVCDTFNTRTGEYVQRIRTLTLNGSEDWFTAFNNLYRLNIKDSVFDGAIETDLLCDRMPITTYYNFNNPSYSGYLYSTSDLSISSIQFNRTLSEWKAHLASNPINVQYQLATPIIKNIKDIEPVLPNKVKNEFDSKTGNYTKKIGRIVLDGSEKWVGSLHSTNGEYYASYFQLNGMKRYKIGEDVSLKCDVFPAISPVHDTLAKETNSEFVATYGSSVGTDKENWLYLSIRASKLSPTSPEGLKRYLKQNPVTVWYELAEPITMKTPKSWSTTTHICSEIPQNSLYPILSHSNPTYPVILKPSTKYSIVANSYSNNHTNSPINFNLGGATASTTVGNRVTMVTTPSTLSNELLTMSGKGNKLNNVMVIEGDVVGDEPYFEGICDVKSPAVKNVGKNLFIAEKHKFLTNHGSYYSIDETRYVTNEVKYHLEPNCQYIFSFKKYGADACWVSVEIDGNYLNNNDRGYSRLFTTSSTGCAGIKISANAGNDKGSKIYDLMLRKATDDDVYEPYKSNTTTFNQKDGKTIVLRSLPNGVCDTLNVETGEYVQRIRGKVFDGKDNGWQVLPYPPHDNDTHYQFKYWFGENLIGGDLWNNAQSILANTLPSASGVLHWSSQGKYGIGGDRSHFMITWEKSSSPFHDVATLNAWLQANPITVQYQLATPIISTIDVQGFPYAYKDGHVQLSSGSIEQSLTPKVKYSLPINRNGQIRMNQKMVERHQKQIDELQAIILANLVNNQYKQTLATLQYELSRV